MDFVPVGARRADVPAGVVEDGLDGLPRGLLPGQGRLGVGAVARQSLAKPS
jgi:hypothetical protein